MRNCIACNNTSEHRLSKGDVKYYQCSFCETLFSDALPNDNMVGGGFEVERNTLQNHERIERFKIICGGQMYGKRILDYGCGNGLLVADLLKADINATGYDKYNPKFSRLPKGQTFDVISMIEVLEHLSNPFEELDIIRELLSGTGVLMLETSFVDIAKEEDIPLESFFYVSPEVGHSSIFSHIGLEFLMLRKGFSPLQPFNRNVRLFAKYIQ